MLLGYSVTVVFILFSPECVQCHNFTIKDQPYPKQKRKLYKEAFILRKNDLYFSYCFHLLGFLKIYVDCI